MARLTQRKKEAFLEALSGAGVTVTAAAEAAGVSRRTVHRHRLTDPEFSEAWEEAYEQGTDGLEEIAKKRAASGSDTLLIFLLKGRRPEKFARFEVSGPKGGAIQHEHRGVSLDDILRVAASTSQESDRPENQDD